jgi:ligand-binding sensor domain-containing protein/signal transduction histidine kinase
MGLFHGSGILLACLLLWPAVLAPTARAAQGVFAADFDIQSWTSEDGLPDDVVSSIQQTREGFLWVGTSRGLVRFDGWRFTLVACAIPANVSSTAPLKVTAQCVDSSNMLWFGTDAHGVFRLDPQTPLPIKASSMGLENERINSMGADEDGAVWIGTEKGLVQWQGDKLIRTDLEPGQADLAVLALQVTRSNGVWVTTSEGLRRIQDGRMQTDALPENPAQIGDELSRLSVFRGIFEDRGGSLWCFGDTYLLNLTQNRRFNYFRGGGATPLQVWSICEGKQRQLWIGTIGQGLFHFAGGRFYAVDLREGRDHTNVRAVFVDKDEHLWVGTHAGLLRLREPIVRWFGAEAGAATCLAQDPDGRVWAGFEHGGLYSGRGDLLQPAGDTIPFGAQNLISGIYIRPDSSFWMGTAGNGLLRIVEGRVQRYSTADGLSDDAVVTVAGGFGPRVWVATLDGKAHRLGDLAPVSFDTRHGLTGNPLTAIIRARVPGLWVGTSQGEILKFEEERFRLLPGPRNFQGRPVSALFEDGSQRFWVGTKGGGLGCYYDGKWTVWSTENGLPDNTVIGIEESAQGELWLATSHGVSKLPETWLPPISEGSLDDRTLQILVEFPKPRQISSAPGWPRSMRTRDGRLWFATDTGVVSFNPAELELSARANEVRIESVRANQAALELPVGGKLPAHFKLPAGLRELKLQFTSPNLAFPDKVRFRHMLDGFDPYWVDSSENRFAHYGRLPPGDYVFRVQCSDIERSWSGPEAVLALTVPTAFWKTPLALSLQTIALAAIVGGVVRGVSHRRFRRQLERAEQQRAMERERSRIAQDMHDELGAKLTKISFLSERARNDLDGPDKMAGTTAKLESIASTSRDLLQSLDEIVWAVNPRNDSLESLAAYFGQYASEYLQNTAVEFDLRMPGELPHVPLSAEVRHNLFLAFEEALGNALKHSGATRVRVSMAYARDQFKIVVSDNGRGLAPTSASGNGGSGQTVNRAGGIGGTGLRGMRDRLVKSGGEFQVNSLPGQGTEIIFGISVPVQRVS